MQLFHDTVDYLCCWQNLERPVPFSPNDAGFLIWSNILSMSVKWVVFRALMLNFVFHSFIIPNQNMRNVLSPVILLCSRHMYPVNMGVFVLKEGVIWMPVFHFMSQMLFQYYLFYNHVLFLMSRKVIYCVEKLNYISFLDFFFFIFWCVLILMKCKFIGSDSGILT